MDRQADRLPLRFPLSRPRVVLKILEDTTTSAAKQRCEQWNLTLSTCEVCPRGTNGNPAPELFVILDRDVPHLDSTATRKCWPHLRGVGLRTPRRATGPAPSDERVAQKGQSLTSSQHSASLRLDFGVCPFGCKEA